MISQGPLPHDWEWTILEALLESVKDLQKQSALMHQFSVGHRENGDVKNWRRTSLNAARMYAVMRTDLDRCISMKHRLTGTFKLYPMVHIHD